MVDDQQRADQPPGRAHGAASGSEGGAGGSAGGAGGEGYVGTLEDAVLHNTSQFHKWHSELEAACASETEEKYKRYADLLNSHVGSCETILAKVGRRRLGWSDWRRLVGRPPCAPTALRGSAAEPTGWLPWGNSNVLRTEFVELALEWVAGNALAHCSRMHAFRPRHRPVHNHLPQFSPFRP